MRVNTFSVLFLLVAIYLTMSVAAEAVIDDFIQPHSYFICMLIGTVITSVAALSVDLDVPV